MMPMARKWMERAGERLGSGASSAGESLAETWDSAQEAALRSRDAGLEAAFAAGRGMLAGARSAGLTTRRAVAGHPAEALLLAGLAGAALGWVLHRVYQARNGQARGGRSRSTGSRSRRASS